MTTHTLAIEVLASRITRVERHDVGGGILHLDEPAEDNQHIFGSTWEAENKPEAGHWLVCHRGRFWTVPTADAFIQ